LTVAINDTFRVFVYLNFLGLRLLVKGLCEVGDGGVCDRLIDKLIKVKFIFGEEVEGRDLTEKR
jgi:hypothetical protein